MSLLPAPFWLVGFRFFFSLKVSLHWHVRGLSFFLFLFFHPLSYFVPVSASQQEMAYTWFSDLFCSCIFSGLKEKVFVLMWGPQSVFICTITVIFSLAGCDVCCFYYMFSFRPWLCRYNSIQANVKYCCKMWKPTRNKYSCIFIVSEVDVTSTPDFWTPLTSLFLNKTIKCWYAFS